MKKNSILFLLLISSLCSSQEKILMVGNSFTFYYNLPNTIELMAKAKGLNWEVNQSSAGGVTLKEHWLGEKELKTKALLSQNQYTKVVFQDKSTYPLIAIDTTKKYLGLLRTLIKQPTAQYVYSTWAYPNISSPAKGKITSQTIEKALKSMLGVRPNELILVGRAFDLFQERYPKYPLLTDDQKHPNPNGSYLAACIFFASFSELSTLGLPHREEGFDQFGKKIFYFIIEEEIALLCQKIADEVVLGMVKS
mgnify:FL=1|tara:strand:+ start:578 stop:1330 length:753 start_codon:yes stop_codon:yes gene_type:complete